MCRYRVTLTHATRTALGLAAATYNEGVSGGSFLRFPGEVLERTDWLWETSVTHLNLMDFREHLHSFSFLVGFLDDQSLIPTGPALQGLLEDLTALVRPQGKLVGLRHTVAMCALPLQAGLLRLEDAPAHEHLRNVLLGIQRGYTAVRSIQSGVNRTRKRPGWPNQSGYPANPAQFHARVGEILSKHFPE